MNPCERIQIVGQNKEYPWKNLWTEAVLQKKSLKWSGAVHTPQESQCPTILPYKPAHTQNPMSNVMNYQNHKHNIFFILR
jgi:hypothetical protein